MMWMTLSRVSSVPFTSSNCEVINACLALIDDPELTIKDLMEHMPGPDFPTAGVINGVRGIHEAYHTGRGRVYIRARSHIEGEDGAKQSIVVTELPYQVNKARLLEKIAELVKEKRLEGISGLRDESDCRLLSPGANLILSESLSSSFCGTFSMFRTCQPPTTISSTAFTTISTATVGSS